MTDEAIDSEKDDELPPIDVTDAVRQRFAWDILGCDEVANYWSTLDLVPPNEDVADMSHHDSHDRMMTVASLVPAGEIFIILATDIISEVLVANNIVREGMTEDEVNAARKVMIIQNREVVRNAFYPILAHMLESGYIKLGPNAPHVVSLEG